MNAPKLTGGRCQCTVCREYFTSTATFDRHRVGQFAKPGEQHGTRRCLAVADMIADGWVKNQRGFWTNVPPQAAYSDIAAPRAPLPVQHQGVPPAMPQMHVSEGTP